ncbi:hypothetical protein CGT77_09920 [Vibrio cholerae]|nr:hypothetical protein CGT98_04590 [Vibrio metoecus]PAR54752.1 hypothetical protein CGT93_07840 [Vibrio metoecus]PAS08706.1 hypothetical protein CGT77_09920 [Vibrio cholerae]PAS17402.1 hypothetical protein CGT75_06065 [Vibrio cholerae]
MFSPYPFPLDAAGVLAAFIHPNHIVYLCSWGFIHLPPTCNDKWFGHIKRLGIRKRALAECPKMG